MSIAGYSCHELERINLSSVMFSEFLRIPLLGSKDTMQSADLSPLVAGASVSPVSQLHIGSPGPKDSGQAHLSLPVLCGSLPALHGGTGLEGRLHVPSILQPL